MALEGIDPYSESSDETLSFPRSYPTYSDEIEGDILIYSSTQQLLNERNIPNTRTMDQMIVSNEKCRVSEGIYEEFMWPSTDIYEQYKSKITKLRPSPGLTHVCVFVNQSLRPDIRNSWPENGKFSGALVSASLFLVVWPLDLRKFR